MDRIRALGTYSCTAWAALIGALECHPAGPTGPQRRVAPTTVTVSACEPCAEEPISEATRKKTTTAPVVIIFRNEMRCAFRITHALLVLDGDVLYERKDSRALSAKSEILVFAGKLPTGEHSLHVLIVLRGCGEGASAYLNGYTFQVQSKHDFGTTEDEGVQIDVVPWEKGTETTPIEQRPAVRYVERIRKLGAPTSRDRAPEKGSGNGPRRRSTTSTSSQ